MNQKTKVAVFFGGQSTEHEVSVISGLQVLSAIDTTKYNAVPVYIDPEGNWWFGDSLRQRKTYPINPQKKPRDLKQVELVMNAKHSGRGCLRKNSKKLFNKDLMFYFDIALPVFHGTKGEDGMFQGLMEMANIPYAGTRACPSAVFMNKALSKNLFQQLDLPVLPAHCIKKPAQEFFDVDELTKDIKIDFPVCVKPANLGSSIGVHKANNEDDLSAALLDIFRMDTEAIIEPFVENLIEYNVAVSNALGEKTRLSVIERPISDNNGVLDFKAKYLSTGEDKDSKLSVQLTEGMVSATREFNPESLQTNSKKLIIETATKLFNHMSGTGAPRLDFYGNEKTGEVWLNEINTIPGSYGYFLWEAADEPVSFTELTTALIEEGLAVYKQQKQLTASAAAGNATLF